jgi:DNA replication licensing factor MCM6
MSRFDLFFVVLDECNEKVDTELSSHIVDLHMRKDEAINPPFTTEQLQRYIRYARTFKPVMTKEARDYMVEKYKELRADDAQGLGRNSYRITVRQLESMVRLSEAIARANCVEEITPAFVHEAYNLLRQSIIHVDMDDVDVTEEDVLELPAAANGGARSTGFNGHGPAVNGNSTSSQINGHGRGHKERTKITYDKYMTIMNLLVRRITMDSHGTDGSGVTKEDLVNWYLEHEEDNLPTVDAYNSERELVQKVIKRLEKDSILMPVRGEGLRETGARGTHADTEMTSFVLHPNSAILETLPDTSESSHERGDGSTQPDDDLQMQTD